MNILNLIKKNKFFSIPIVFIFLVIIIITIMASSSRKNNLQDTTISIPHIQITPRPPIKQTVNNGIDKEDTITSKQLIGLQKTETLKDGTIKYTIISQNPKKPNTIIATKEGFPLFKSTVSSENSELSLKSFIKLYGQAKWVFKGSVSYGPDFQTYVYPEYGFALIANPQIDQVIERHTFEKTKVEDYVNKYGDDIPSQP